MRGVLGTLLVCCFLFVSLQAGNNEAAVPSGDQTITLESNGYFRAENGLFFVNSQTIYLYSHVPTIINPKTGRFEMQPDNDELKSEWSGQPYYLTVYELNGGKWDRKTRTFSQAPSSYLDFGPCDPFNQLDVRAQFPEVATILPATSKIKQVTQFGPSQHCAVVVYSEPAADTTITYALKVALITKVQNEWKLLKSQEAGEFGWFCGTRTISTRLNETPASDLLLYTDEPAGSSDYIAIHSFLIAMNPLH
jgi:hypothetical protein